MPAILTLLMCPPSSISCDGFPAAEVLDVATHDWAGDEYSGETWPMHKTGFLSRHLAGMQKPHGRVLFASSDIANGWGGFIDGAIESGIEAAQQAGILLESVALTAPR